MRRLIEAVGWHWFAAGAVLVGTSWGFMLAALVSWAVDTVRARRR